MKKYIIKKIAILSLAACFGTSWTVCFAASAGDFNNDGSVNAGDVSLLQNYLIGKSNSVQNADMNGDGIINIADLCLAKDAVLNPQQSTSAGGKNEPASGTAMLSDFRKNQAGDFFASDGWDNGNPFNVTWHESNAYVKDGLLTLVIDKETQGGKTPYSGGEFRTNKFYGYGYYETSMKAIKNDGTVSSFFTYTGESDNNPWDEIDIEVLGKDTTKVQFNYYTNGHGEHEFMYDLGFDASEDFHKYGFDWQADKITWYVDGKAVYTANKDIPKTPGKIMMNAWAGIGVDEWLKAYNGNTPLKAQYEWVTYDGTMIGANSSEAASKGNNNQQGQDPNQGQGQNPWGGWTDPNQGQGQQQGSTNGNEPASDATMLSDFRKNEKGDFFASDGWDNGDPFNVTWHESNAYVKDGLLSLVIDKETQGGKTPYSGGEFRTNDFYSYGYYETSMKAIKNDGTVSSFFTYTGPSDNNPWDEIDVEVLGKDTTKVQFNYYTNGQGGHEFMYDLGFDASQGFHKFGFDWQPDHITWYVDGKAVYTAYQDIPKTPGKIMMNAWAGKGVDEWLKAFNGKTPLTAQYEWVTYKKK